MADVVATVRRAIRSSPGRLPELNPTHKSQTCAGRAGFQRKRLQTLLMSGPTCQPLGRTPQKMAFIV